MNAVHFVVSSAALPQTGWDGHGYLFPADPSWSQFYVFFPLFREAAAAAPHG